MSPSKLLGVEGSRINMLDDSAFPENVEKESEQKGGFLNFVKRFISRRKKPVKSLPLEAIHMVGKRAQAYVDLISLGYERWARYLDYDMMDLTTGEISQALDIYVSETVREDEAGDSIKISRRGAESTEYEVKDFEQLAVTELFNILELNSGRNLYRIVRDLVKFGDAFCLLIPAEEKRGIGELRVLHPMSVKRIEVLETGKTFFFHGPSIRESIDPPSMRRYSPQYSGKNFFENDPMVFETEHDLNEFIRSLKSAETSSYFGRASENNPYLRWQVYPNAEDPVVDNSEDGIPHILHIALNPGSFAPYGSSILESVRLKWKQVKAIEDAVIVYRLVRAPERKVVKIDVGDLPPNEADLEVRRVAQSLRKEPIIDTETGELAYMPMILGITEDIFIGQREGRKIEIDTLPAAQNVAEIDDLLYFKKAMLEGLRIPLNYLTYDAKTETLGILALQDVRLVNQVKRIQDWIAKGLEAVIKCHYHMLGREREIPNFEVKITTPASIEEKQRLEELGERIDLGAKLAELGVDRGFILREIIRVYPDEMSHEGQGEES